MFRNDDKKSSDVKNFTRGGQIILHNVRMLNQIANHFFIIGLVIFILITIPFLYWLVSHSELIAAGWYIKASCLHKIMPNHLQTFTWINGVIYKIKPEELLNFPELILLWKQFLKHFFLSTVMSLIITILILGLSSYFIRKHGEKHTNSKQIRGDQLLSVKEVSELIKKDKQNSDLEIGGLPLIKNSEIRNFFIHGTVGSGKTVLIRKILDYIRKRGDRAIVYDKGCDFIPAYYRPETDTILNPLDQRCANWNLWSECQSRNDYEAMAAALIPMQSGESDPFWVNAARTIFSAAAFQMQKDSNRSTLHLLRYLLTSDLETISKLLKGTEAESLVSEKIEKTAISIKSVLATYLKSLRYLEGLDGQYPYSIKEWVRSEKASSWLFVSSNAEQHASLRPLISMWLDVATGSLLSLPSDLNRRVWLILDESPSLHKLPYLPETFSEARKFGGCIVIGMQAFSQMKKVYGPNAAEEISGLCNTRFFFRSPSHETAEWVSRELGQAEIEDVQENYSYGANTMRDGISVGTHRTTRAVVSASDIMQQRDLQAFVRLPGDWPITQINLEFVPPPQLQTNFILRPLNDKALQDTDKLIQTLEENFPASLKASEQDIRTRLSQMEL